MKHARKDYNRLQDPENKIPEDEPVFLLRGQDVCAPYVVRSWAIAAKNSGADKDMVLSAMRHALLMEEWQADHGSKIPDIPW